MAAAASSDWGSKMIQKLQPKAGGLLNSKPFKIGMGYATGGPVGAVAALGADGSPASQLGSIASGMKSAGLGGAATGANAIERRYGALGVDTQLPDAVAPDIGPGKSLLSMPAPAPLQMPELGSQFTNPAMGRRLKSFGGF